MPNKKVIYHQSYINTSAELREGQSIEDVLRIATANKEPVGQVMPEMYQARNEGIDPLCDVRTDKFDLALRAQDKITRAHLLAHQNRDNFGKGDNSWITDEDGNPIFENPIEQNE